jgi:DDE family transposase
VLEELPDGSYRSAVYANPKARRNNTDAIPVRVIEYTVTSGENTSDFRLITTILDPDAAPAQDLAELYGRRWEIESCFDELKTHQRGPGIVLRSKTPDGVLQEIYGYLCVHYALRSLIGEVALLFKEDPLRFSFTRTLRAARRTLADRPAFSP